jgi:hypothetical protein
MEQNTMEYPRIKSVKQRTFKYPHIFLVVISIALISGLCVGCSRPPENTEQEGLNGPVILILTRLDANESGLSVHIFDVDQHQLYLEPGTYYGEALHPDESITVVSDLIVPTGEGDQTRVDVSSLETYALNGDEAAQQLATIAGFLVAVDNVRLAYLEIVSAGFAVPLFDTAVETSWEDVARLEEALNGLGDEPEVIKAVQAFINRGTDSAYQTGKNGLARVVAGPLDILKDIASFFGICSDEDEIAREDMIKTLQTEMEYYESTEILEIINEFYPEVNTLDEFVQNLKDDKVENSRIIRQQLFQRTPYNGLYQTLNPDANRPDGETIHRVGAEALTRGSELYVNIVKDILSTAFPGMDQGFEYADKVNEFAEFVRDFYNDPTSALVDAVKGQIEDAVKNQIKEQFMDLFPEIEEDQADEIAGHIMDQINEIQEAQEELAEELQEEQEEQEEEMDEQASEPIILPPDTTLGTETFVDGDVTYTFFEGHGSYCNEVEGTYIYRWSLDLLQEVEAKQVLGTVKFHDCPGGGRVLYRVEGFVNEDGTFTLSGTKRDGGGDLYSKAPAATQFTFDPTTGVISPNYAP